MPAAGTTVKSDQRRQGVVDAAVRCFARKGFYGTTTHEIAERAGISQPYLYRLFANKQTIFVAAVEHVGGLLTEALSTADTTAKALQDAYGTIIEDGDILRFLMQANCATDEPLIRDAVRACYARQVAVVDKLLDGDDEAVRRWFAVGMLANVTTVLDLAEIDEPWAKTLANI
ncbi:hypothetical protein Acy02nite_82240 [Actinoplanes cyaneus]|uniref:HTH tetR-type domain-containing protein n=1 Tax=Actinoplanes cyaneus TaxID=52696 RepID=A0A919MAB2_9ACTN|nr:TetR/AcrR family transcriptional regulator [Actinoplanes cyaneus]MCW2143489.1 transcriptional regulator, TetR family [Actinoplanes cyaneus]GID70343.1 hypothetical protein Acy02nite_82240 [Actinoplanes cyaneus]